MVATGYLESRRQAMIGARAAGRIEVVNVEEGSRVTSGQILAVLEHRDVDAALAAMKATQDRAWRSLRSSKLKSREQNGTSNRAEKLWKNNSTTEERLRPGTVCPRSRRCAAAR